MGASTAPAPIWPTDRRRAPTPCRARMRNQYSADDGGRPRWRCDDGWAEPGTARLFLCAGCRRQAVICGHCDRGQRYCSEECAARARRLSLQAAGRRYQGSPRGRQLHAARARRYRARCEIVTHHGSPPPSPAVPLAPGPRSCGDAAAPVPDAPSAAAPRCHWCGRACPTALRQGPLRRRRRLRRPSATASRRHSPDGDPP